MNNKEKFYAEEHKQEIIKERNYTCEVCGKNVYKYGPPVLAHRVSKSKMNIKKYGLKRIHHRMNIKLVCNNPACNDACNIGFNTIHAESLMKEIQKEIDNE